MSISIIASSAVVQVEGVWKSFGRTQAVRGLSLMVQAESVYGFLGPNGAGKSTTIRMVLGLQRPDRGAIALFEKPLASERVRLLRRIGSLVESPSLYQNLTGREHLEIHRRLLDVPQRAIDEALETVGLLSAGGRLVRHYSSGMKQRLGIAQALLGNPELLVLDEPTNGLDPAGIHEMRSLIRDLPKRRRVTVFLSSHLLSEVEQVATHFAIISEGTLKFEGTPQDLEILSEKLIIVAVDQPDRAESLLIGLGCSVRREGDRLLVAPDGCMTASEINSVLVRAGCAVSLLSTRSKGLEEIFLDLTNPAHGEMEFAR